MYTIQHQAGCTNDVRINNQLQLAAQRHAVDVLNNRDLNGDIGSDGSTPQIRAAAAGFPGTNVAETVAIMRDCRYSLMGVWSENLLDRTVVVAMYGQPA